MPNPKFEIFTGVNSQHYFRLRAANGEVILSSEGYVSREGCRSGIASVQSNAPYENRYERSDEGTYTFVLKALNGQVIGRSESYSTRAARDNGIATVKNTAPYAPVEGWYAPENSAKIRIEITPDTRPGSANLVSYTSLL